jgi:hypothetical protein
MYIFQQSVFFLCKRYTVYFFVIIFRFHEQLELETLKPQYMQNMIPMCMEGHK